MPSILGANTLSSGYDVANSVRFNDDDSAYMHKTPGGAGNRRTFTFSTWVKRGNLGAGNIIFAANTQSTSDGYVAMYFSSHALRIRIYESSAKDVVTNMLFRDISAWYHIVVAVDTTQGTEANRVKIYVNGSEATKASGSYVSQNFDTSVNNTVIQQVGVGRNSGSSLENYFDGYLAETVLIDGTALDQTSFGEFDEDSGIWKPISVSGLTFGTNGFYLDFEDSSNLGNDVNGGTDLTEVNLAATDQSTDTCTNNFAVLNPIGNTNDQYANFSEGNLKVAGNDNTNGGYTNSTIAPSQGKWYMEFKAIDIQGSSYPGVGIISTQDATNNGQVGGATNSVSYRAGGTILTNGSTTDTESTYTDNDIIGVAMDLDNGAVYFHKNGTYQNSGDPTSGSSKTGSLYSFTVSDSYHFATTVYQSTAIVSANFGSPPFTISSGNSDGNGYGNFEYAVPSGYYAINTKNLAEYG